MALRETTAIMSAPAVSRLSLPLNCSITRHQQRARDVSVVNTHEDSESTIYNYGSRDRSTYINQQVESPEFTCS